MIKVEFYRKEADFHDFRRFRRIDELNSWLKLMKELEDEYYITNIEFED